MQDFPCLVHLYSQSQQGHQTLHQKEELETD